MKTLSMFVLAVVVSIIAGCGGDKPQEAVQPAQPEKVTQADAGEKVFLTVDFNEGETLKYQFITTRLITLDWDPTKTEEELKGSKTRQIAETVDMQMAYTPIKVDPYGVTTIEANCTSMSTLRESPSGITPQGRDAVKTFDKKTYTFTVGPTGRILDNSQLHDLIELAGAEAFRKGDGPRVKEPDLISDFIATQWFLWDSVSSIPNPSEGVAVGQKWHSRLSVPTPMVVFKARNVEYTLSEIAGNEKERIAIITCQFSPAESAPNTWPIPYEGSFQMAGTFGFLRGYKMTALTGEGIESFNIDKGRLQAYEHIYTAEFDAVIPMIGANPHIKIEQKLLCVPLIDKPADPNAQEGR